MEDIITGTRISNPCTRSPIDSKSVPNTSREDRRPERPSVKFHKCGSTSNLARNCTKNIKIDEAQVIQDLQGSEEKEESDQDAAISEETPSEEHSIENITDFFKVTEVHTHLPQYSEDF
ncbi:hypothetical protein O181_024651 [Austropuccinia psidii MF-1]|uniref:Uncharacterized protein n=1 Tax=Austropuccinia psidii MF-1 TaxID=1389203 RepID=A0A9Q3CH46_9BASI|nr:hypothetical protein [Austropuccinia psidii MF-1]